MFMRVRKSLPVRSIPPAKSFTPGGGFQTFWNSWNVSEDFDVPTLAKCEKAVPEICELPPHRTYSSVRVWEMRPAVSWATPPVASCTARDGRAVMLRSVRRAQENRLWLAQSLRSARLAGFSLAAIQGCCW